MESPEILPPSESHSGSAPSGTTEPYPGKSAETERILSEAGVGAEPEILSPDAGPKVGEPVTYDLGWCGPVTIGQSGVRQILPVVFGAAAKGLKKPELQLEDYELDLFTPAVTGCINRYLPALLKRTDSPELALLGIAAMAYAFRVGAGPLIEKIMAKFSGDNSSAPATETADSAASSPTSASPEPEKHTGSLTPPAAFGA